MRPEEIDKIFKDRLGNTSPTPPADLWNRLQAKMEAEMPTQIKPDEEKKSFMWIYSSIAASLALLLTVGVVFYNIKSTPEISQTLATKERPILEETPIRVAPETIAQTEVDRPEKKSDAQATEVNALASTNTESDNKTTAAIKERTKAAKQPVIASVAKQSKQVTQNTIANNTLTTDKPAESVEQFLKAEPATSLTVNASNSNMNAQPVEITIKRSTSAANALAITDDGQPSEFDKKTDLAKNIFKQVRNLANGEQVELADLGIRADKLALGAQIGKQKFSKVINL